MQGAGPTSPDFFTNLTARINGVDTCAELQHLTAEAFQDIADVKNAIEAELADLQPLIQLLTNPGADLAKIATWIGNCITALITPLTKPQVTMIAQLTKLASEIAALTAAIEAAAARLTSCSVSVPSVSITIPGSGS